MSFGDFSDTVTSVKCLFMRLSCLDFTVNTILVGNWNSCPEFFISPFSCATVLSFTFCLLYYIWYYSLLLLCCVLIMWLHHLHARSTQTVCKTTVKFHWGRSDDITIMWCHCFPFYILSIFTFDLWQNTADIIIHYSIDTEQWNIYLVF